MADSLDIEDPLALTSYLRATGRVAMNERLAARTLCGGVSNKTVLVEREGGEGWVLKQALPRLRVAVEWFSDPARIRREAEGLRCLEKLAPAGTITPLVFEDRDQNLLAMKAVPLPHENWKLALLDGRIDFDHARQFASILATIHRSASLQASEMAPRFDDRSFFESLRIEPYYLYSAGRVPEAAGFLRGLVDDTLRRRFTLVHGDYSPKNILVHRGRLVLLDHEVIHWGDPSFDLGFASAHLLSKAHHLPGSRNSFLEVHAMFWSEYSRSLGDVPWADDLEAFAVRQTLGCLLARVAGRSPLEYLSADELARQRGMTLALMADAPGTLDSLRSRWRQMLEDGR